MVEESFELHNNMDQNQYGQHARKIGAAAEEAKGKNQYEPNIMGAPTNPPTHAAGPSASSSYLREQQYIHQLQQQHLQYQLNNFWANQMEEIQETNDFRTHSLPLAKINNIMKADEDVDMISAEAPVVFAKASEIFIMELTTRAWISAEENRRLTLQKNDIAYAILKTDVFDFLLDVVPWDDTLV